MVVDARKEKEQLDRCCGEILRAVVSVETFIDIFISEYFCMRNRIGLFQNIIVGENMNLHRKIQVIKKIFKYEQEIRKIQGISQLDFQKIKETIKALDEIRETRNIVAHAMAVFDGQCMYLERNKAGTTEKDRRRITPQFVKDFRHLMSKALFGINEINNILKTT